ncbi:MAG: radical SAM protein [Actinomycetota bacterium]
MAEYLRLHNNFRVLKYDTYLCLFNNKTAAEFLLDREQAELIYLLDGTRTTDNVLSEFDKESQETVRTFVSKLSSEGCLESIANPQKRIIDLPLVQPYLEGVLFDITSLCNLRCHHCYVSDFYKEKRGKDLSLDEIYGVLDDLAAMNVRDVAVTGGEPILRDDIRKIIEGIVARNMRLGSFFTNGLEIEKDFVSFISSLPQFTRIYISLDGLTPYSHSMIRGGDVNSNVTHAAAIRAIEMFASAGVPVTINTSLHQKNLSELPAMYQLLKRMNVSQWRIAVPKPIGRYKETQPELKPQWDNVLAAYAALLDIHLQDVSVSNEGFTSPIEVEFELLFRTEIVYKKIKFYQPGDIACLYHKNRCSIKANGDVTPCGYFDYIVAGNIRETPIQQIWISNKMQSVKTMKIAEVSECKDCPSLAICGTGCRAVAHRLTGDIRAKDEYACAQVIKFHKEVVTPLFEKYGFSVRGSAEVEDIFTDS